jgi:hypothetical protein
LDDGSHINRERIRATSVQPRTVHQFGRSISGPSKGGNRKPCLQMFYPPKD